MRKILIITFYLLFQGLCFAQWNTDRIMTIGRNALYFEDYVLSIQYFNRLIAVKPNLADPYMYRAMAKVQLGDYQGADNDCTLAIRLNPFIPQAYYTRGFARMKLGFYEDASSDFTKALEFSPNSGFLLLSRMDAESHLHNYEGALADLEQYMEKNPKIYDLYYEKGRIQLALKDTVSAQTTFNEFVEKDPKNSLAWSARGLLHLQKEELDEALNDYNKAIELKSGFYGDYLNRAIINVRKNNYRQAMADYDKAIQMERTSALAYYNRGLLRATLGDTNSALDDLVKVLQLEPDNMEARLQKAMIEDELRNYETAIDDYKAILEKHPTFIPAYMGIAKAEHERGNERQARIYQQKAIDMEDELKKKKKEENTEELIAENIIDDQAQKNVANRTERFNRFAAQNMEQAEKESKYSSETRGAVQEQYTDLVTERNFVLTYYAKADDFRQTNHYHPLITIYNNDKAEGPDLKITNDEIPLTEELVNIHFESLNEISSLLEEDGENADTYFKRAMEFSLIQDFTDAIQDLNKVIVLQPDFALAYFNRANIRYKQIEYTSTLEKPLMTAEERKLAEKQYTLDSEMIIRDYDKVLSLAPDFSYAYFNKANLMASLKDFRSAVSNYTRAIESDPGFAEAYFNRGLIYLFLEEDTKGLSDLSKAGELGMYKAYNLIKRFNN